MPVSPLDDFDPDRTEGDPSQDFYSNHCPHHVGECQLPTELSEGKVVGTMSAEVARERTTGCRNTATCITITYLIAVPLGSLFTSI